MYDATRDLAGWDDGYDDGFCDTQHGTNAMNNMAWYHHGFFAGRADHVAGRAYDAYGYAPPPTIG